MTVTSNLTVRQAVLDASLPIFKQTHVSVALRHVPRDVAVRLAMSVTGIAALLCFRITTNAFNLAHYVASKKVAWQIWTLIINVDQGCRKTFSSK